MHELSVAHALVTTVIGSVGEKSAGVREVHARIGVLSGVVPQALDFAYDVACEGTPLSGSVLVVESVPARIHCPACDIDAEVEGTFVLVCPSCGAASGDVRGGRELDISHVVLHDAPVGVIA